MNEQTTQLIEKLAEQLGTTSEYLWEVMIKQAPITATTTLAQIIFVVLFGIALYKLHRKYSTEIEGDSYNENLYDKNPYITVIPMVLGAILWISFALTSFLCLPEVINGFFNPEYWALNTILNKL